ncbi:GNAT family N-acetyltransferase [Rhodococcus sp. NPDC056506]|uniref:GNAT family N-acetyltransferase n=1 Tax=Rhodococcus sp. NPDC056506 TaxID=3345844 RepID=UPI00367141AF
MDEIVIERATDEDAAEILVLQRCCWVSEAISNNSMDIPPLQEDLPTVRAWVEESTVWTARRGGRLVGAVRGTADGTAWQIGRLMVAPDLAGNGLGRRLLQHVEQNAPAHITSFELFTGSKSVRNIRLYSRAGYVQLPTNPNHIPGVVYLSKPKVAVAD